MAFKGMNVNLQFNADTSRAQQQIQQLQNTLNSLSIKQSGNFGIVKEIDEGINAATKLQSVLSSATNGFTGKLDLSAFNSSLKQSGMTLDQYAAKMASLGPAGQQAFAKVAQAVSQAQVPMRTLGTGIQSLMTSLANVAKYQLSTSILTGFTSTIQSAVSYAQDLNKSLTSIQIVSGQTSSQMAQFAAQANKAAQALSTTTTKYTDAALIFYQQGLNSSQVEERMSTVIKMMHATGDAASDVSSYMTAIWNNFDDGSASLESYADAIAKLGATTAASSSEIAEGLSKFASIAKTTGLSYDYATSALATLVANTRQSADTIGNSLKTIFSRLQGLKLGETLEDGVDLNKYSTALQTVGVSVLDAAGNMKDLDTILDSLASKWQTLSSAQQTALAQTVGGTRQYTQLISLMENWDDMQKNLTTVQNSGGTLDQQQETYAQGWEAAKERVTAAAEDIYSSLVNDKAFISMNNGFTGILQTIKSIIDQVGGLKGVLMGIGGIVTTVFSKQISSGITNFFTQLTMNTNKAQQSFVQLKQSAIQSLQNIGTGQTGSGTSDALTNIYKTQADAQNLLVQKMEVYRTLKTEINELDKASIDTAQKAADTQAQQLEQSIMLTEQKKQAQSDAQATYMAQASAASVPPALTGLQAGDMAGLAAAGSAFTAIQTKLAGFANDQGWDVGKQKAQELATQLKEQLGGDAPKSFQKVQQSLEALSSASVKDSATFKTTFEQFKNDLKEAMTASEGEIQSFKQNLSEALEGNINKDTILKTFDDLITKSREAGQAYGDVANKTSDFASAQQRLVQEIEKAGPKIASTSQLITQGVGAISQFGMLLSTASSSMKTLFDADAEPIQKVTAAIMLLTTAYYAFNTVRNLANAIALKSVASNGASAAASAIAAAATDKQAAATAKATAQQLALNAAQKANPFIAVISLVLAAITGILTAIQLIKKAREEAAKAAAEERKLKIENEEKKGDSTIKEQEEKAGLIKSYNELYAAYEKTGSGQSELAASAYKLADAYGMVGAAVLIASGNFKEFNRQLQIAFTNDAYKAAGQLQENATVIKNTALSANVDNGKVNEYANKASFDLSPYYQSWYMDTMVKYEQDTLAEWTTKYAGLTPEEVASLSSEESDHRLQLMNQVAQLTEDVMTTIANPQSYRGGAVYTYGDSSRQFKASIEDGSSSLTGNQWLTESIDTGFTTLPDTQDVQRPIYSTDKFMVPSGLRDSNFSLGYDPEVIAQLDEEGTIIHQTLEEYQQEVAAVAEIYRSGAASHTSNGRYITSGITREGGVFGIGSHEVLPEPTDENSIPLEQYVADMLVQSGYIAGYNPKTLEYDYGPTFSPITGYETDTISTETVVTATNKNGLNLDRFNFDGTSKDGFFEQVAATASGFLTNALGESDGGASTTNIQRTLVDQFAAGTKNILVSYLSQYEQELIGAGVIDGTVPLASETCQHLMEIYNQAIEDGVLDGTTQINEVDTTIPQLIYDTCIDTATNFLSTTSSRISSTTIGKTSQTVGSIDEQVYGNDGIFSRNFDNTGHLKWNSIEGAGDRAAAFDTMYADYNTLNTVIDQMNAYIGRSNEFQSLEEDTQAYIQAEVDRFTAMRDAMALVVSEDATVSEIGSQVHKSVGKNESAGKLFAAANNAKFLIGNGKDNTTFSAFSESIEGYRMAFRQNLKAYQEQMGEYYTKYVDQETGALKMDDLLKSEDYDTVMSLVNTLADNALSQYTDFADYARMYNALSSKFKNVQGGKQGFSAVTSIIDKFGVSYDQVTQSFVYALQDFIDSTKKDVINALNDGSWTDDEGNTYDWETYLTKGAGKDSILGKTLAAQTASTNLSNARTGVTAFTSAKSSYKKGMSVDEAQTFYNSLWGNKDIDAALKTADPLKGFETYGSGLIDIATFSGWDQTKQSEYLEAAQAALEDQYEAFGQAALAADQALADSLAGKFNDGRFIKQTDGTYALSENANSAVSLFSSFRSNYHEADDGSWVDGQGNAYYDIKDDNGNVRSGMAQAWKAAGNEDTTDIFGYSLDELTGLYDSWVEMQTANGNIASDQAFLQYIQLLGSEAQKTSNNFTLLKNAMSSLPSSGEDLAKVVGLINTANAGGKQYTASEIVKLYGTNNKEYQRLVKQGYQYQLNHTYTEADLSTIDAENYQRYVNETLETDEDAMSKEDWLASKGYTKVSAEDQALYQAQVDSLEKTDQQTKLENNATYLKSLSSDAKELSSSLNSIDLTSLPKAGTQAWQDLDTALKKVDATWSASNFVKADTETQITQLAKARKQAYKDEAQAYRDEAAIYQAYLDEHYDPSKYTTTEARIKAMIEGGDYSYYQAMQTANTNAQEADDNAANTDSEEAKSLRSARAKLVDVMVAGVKYQNEQTTSTIEKLSTASSELAGAIETGSLTQAQRANIAKTAAGSSYLTQWDSATTVAQRAKIASQAAQDEYVKKRDYYQSQQTAANKAQSLISSWDVTKKGVVLGQTGTGSVKTYKSEVDSFRTADGFKEMLNQMNISGEMANQMTEAYSKISSQITSSTSFAEFRSMMVKELTAAGADAEAAGAAAGAAYKDALISAAKGVSDALAADAQSVVDAWLTAFNAISNAKKSLASGESISSIIAGDTDSAWAITKQLMGLTKSDGTKYSAAEVASLLSGGTVDGHTVGELLTNPTWDKSDAVMRSLKLDKFTGYGTSNDAEQAYFRTLAGTDKNGHQKSWTTDEEVSWRQQYQTDVKTGAGNLYTNDDYIAAGYASSEDFFNKLFNGAATEQAAAWEFLKTGAQYYRDAAVDTSEAARVAKANYEEEKAAKQEAYTEAKYKADNVLKAEQAFITMGATEGDTYRSTDAQIDYLREQTGLNNNQLLTMINESTGQQYQSLEQALESNTFEGLAESLNKSASTFNSKVVSAGSAFYALVTDSEYSSSADKRDAESTKAESEGYSPEVQTDSERYRERTASAYGYDLEAWKDLEQLVRDTHQELNMTDQQITDCVAEMIRAERAMTSLGEISKATWKKIKKGAHESGISLTEYNGYINKVRSALKDLLGIDVDEKFVKDNADLIQKLTNGSTYEERNAAFKDLEKLKVPDVVAKLKLDDSDFESQLEKAIQKSISTDNSTHMLDAINEGIRNGMLTPEEGMALASQYMDGVEMGFDNVDASSVANDVLGDLSTQGAALAAEAGAATGEAFGNSMADGSSPSLGSETASGGTSAESSETVSVESDELGGPKSTSVTTSTDADATVTIPVIKGPSGGGGMKQAPNVKPSGGGGGGGRRRKDRVRFDRRQLKKPEKEIERYHEINKSLDTLSHRLSLVSKAKDMAFGPDRLKALKQENALLKQQADLNAQYYQEAQNYLQNDAQELSKWGFTFDEDGNINNYDENYQKKIDEYNDAYKRYFAAQQYLVDQYNAGKLDDDKYKEAENKLKEQWEDVQEAWEEYQEAIDRYEDSVEQSQKALEAWQESIQSQIANNLEQVQYVLDVKISVKDAELEALNDIMSSIGDNADRAADAIANVLGQQTAANIAKAQLYQNSTEDILRAGWSSIQMDDTQKAMFKAAYGEDFEDMDIDRFVQRYTTGTLTEADAALIESMHLTNEQIEMLKSNQSSLYELNEQLRQQSAQVIQTVSDAFDDYNERLDKSIEKISKLQAVTATYGNILDIVGKKLLDPTGELTEKLSTANFEMQRDNTHALKSQLTSIDSEINNYKQRVEEAKTNGTSKTDLKAMKDALQNMEDKRDEVYQSWLDSWEAEVQAAADIYTAALEGIVSTFESSVAGLAGSLSQLQEEYDRQKQISDVYLDEYDQIYNLSKLTRDINNSIDDTTTIKSKQALKKLLEQINQIQEDGTELSQYDLDVLRAEYELELARAELEDAREAKTTVRMARDSEGNYGYVYSADTSAVQEAEQNYEDKLYAMQKLNSDYIEEMQSQIIQAEQDCSAALAELNVADYASYEEYQAAALQIQEDYGALVEEYYAQLDNALENNSKLYNGAWMDYNKATGYILGDEGEFTQSFEQTKLALLTGLPTIQDGINTFSTATATAVENAATAWATWYANTQIAMEDGGTSITDYAEDMVESTEDLVTTSDQVEVAVSQMAETLTTKFGEATAALQEFQTAYAAVAQQVAAQTQNLANSLTTTLGVLAAALDRVDNTSTPQGATSTPTTTGNATEVSILGEAQNIYSETQKLSRAAERFWKQIGGQGELFDTGGYTGTWGDSEGRWAVLHQKEIVLNADDTENFLSAINMVRDIASIIDLNAATASSGLASLLQVSSGGILSGSDTLEQNVYITAEFKDGTTASEITTALETLVNKASQYANRKNS